MSALFTNIHYLGKCNLEICIPKKYAWFSACYYPPLVVLSAKVNEKN